MIIGITGQFVIIFLYVVTYQLAQFPPGLVQINSSEGGKAAGNRTQKLDKVPQPVTRAKSIRFFRGKIHARRRENDVR